MDKNKEMFDRLVKGLRDIYGDKLVSILLYGSFARKTNTKESDIDIAVLLNGKETKVIPDLTSFSLVWFACLNFYNPGNSLSFLAAF